MHTGDAAGGTTRASQGEPLAHCQGSEYCQQPLSENGTDQRVVQLTSEHPMEIIRWESTACSLWRAPYGCCPSVSRRHHAREHVSCKCRPYASFGSIPPSYPHCSLFSNTSQWLLPTAPAGEPPRSHVGHSSTAIGAGVLRSGVVGAGVA